jgi:hypothetical protein
MNHLQGLCVTSMQTAEPTPNGHSMMLSCPPFSHLVNTPQVAYDPFVQLATPLQRLLDLSRQLPIAPDGEITPIMALDLLRQHPRYPEFDVADFRTLVADLAAMTRCYGCVSPLCWRSAAVLTDRAGLAPCSRSLSLTTPSAACSPPSRTSPLRTREAVCRAAWPVRTGSKGFGHLQETAD